MSIKDPVKAAYVGHRTRARRKGIKWEFTLDSWLKVWIESKHFHERGKKRGQYCMARYGDVGPYSPTNVKIILSSDNVREAQLGRLISEETRLNMKKPKSKKHRANMSKAHKARWAKIRAEQDYGV